MNAWWTDEKVNAVVKGEYVIGKLGPKNHFRIHTPLAFGDGLTDDTYLDWILERGKRIFLILVDIGCPDNIFDIVDRSLDDDDLPLSEAAIWDLDLAHGKNTGLDKKFNRRQFFYLIQELGPGRHVDYGPEDVIPVKVFSKTIGILSSADIDKVSVGSQMFTRRRIPLRGEGAVDRIHFVMYFKSLQKLKHPHVVSVWATYTQGDYAYVLLGPTSETSLKSFLEKPPDHFKNLTKQQKRDTLLRWTHCLTDAIAYLHDNGFAHQAIRPSNVFVDNNNAIFLGEYAAMDALEEEEPVYQREAYEHAPPEKWIRKTVPQSTAPLRSTLNSGGRTNRRLKDPASKPNGLTRRNSSNSGSNGFFRRPSTNPSSNSPPQSPSVSRGGSFTPTVSTTPTSPILPSHPTSPQFTNQQFPNQFVSPHPSALPNAPSAPSRSGNYGPAALSFPFPAAPSNASSGPSRNLPSLPNAATVPAFAFPTGPSSAYPTASSRQGAFTPASNSSGSHTSTVTKKKRVLVTTFTEDNTPTPYPSDIFSLSTIHLLLLSAVFALASDSHAASRFSSDSLRSHLGKMNRNAGRGGAPADSSFHVNLVQADTWLDKLEKEAGKRGDGHFFAIQALVGVVKAGLRERWQERWGARDGEREVRNILEQWVPGGWGTCCAIDAWENERGAAKFGLGLTGTGAVEIGEKKSDGSGYMPSPPYTENGSVSGSTSVSGGSRGRGGRGSMDHSVAEETLACAESVMYIDGVAVEEELNEAQGMDACKYGQAQYKKAQYGQVQENWRQQPQQQPPPQPAMEPLKMELEMLKRELESLRKEVTPKLEKLPVKKEVVRAGRRGGGYGKQQVKIVEKGPGDDLMRSFFKRSQQKR